MSLRESPVLLWLGVFAWIGALPACKATFEPLPDDDSADDDTGDDDTADDDTGDDDTADALFSSGVLELVEGGIYTVYLIGNTSGSPPIGAWNVEDLSSVPNTSQPALRLIHAAASQGPVDWYVDGESASIDINLQGVTPGTIYPPQDQIGYFNPGDPGTIKIDALPPGGEYGVATPVAGDFIESYNPQTYYSVVLTGGPAGRVLTRTVDDLTPPQAGNARLRIFHSIEGLAILDAGAELVDSGNILSLWDDIPIATSGSPWEVPAGAVIIHVYDAI